jgi:DNA-binding PadR family transcriptional regulator
MSGSLAGELAAFRARVRESSLVKGTGRGKKVYGITDLGRERLVELLADPDVSDDREFTLRVAFARHLPDSARLELFERRRTELLGRRDELRRRSGPGQDTYLGALRERDADHLVNDLAWLDRLIAAERDQASNQEEVQ